jgi:ribonuclease H / adenosylcobalamin/alpha-ribazole phosphatase
VSLAGAAARLAGVALAAGALAAAAPAAAQDALAGLPELQSGAVRVYLVRHGQALSNLDPAPQLSTAELDHLTPLGAKQSEAVGRALAGRGVASVYSSPATRARETADAVARALGIPAPTVEARLRPLELGRAPDGRALAWRDRAVDWQAGRDPVPAEGESIEDVGHRVGDFVRALARSRRGQGLVLVAHSEVIAAYLGEVSNTPAPKRYPPEIGNGSISVVDVFATGAQTLRLTNHVPARP